MSNNMTFVFLLYLEGNRAIDPKKIVNIIFLVIVYNTHDLS